MVFWPEGEPELAIAESEDDLFLLLDREGNPCGAEIYEVDPGQLGPVLLKMNFSSVPDEIPVKRIVRFDEDVEDVYKRILPGS